MSREERQLSIDQIKDLRDRGMITYGEIAFVAGDLLVAENVTTQEKRIIGETKLLNESTRRVLKG